MTLTELRYIVMLARERHFGRAAEKCHVSQPTLSVALKKVEQRHGVILFERSSSDVRLTPIGEKIARQAEKVLEEADRLTELAVQGKDPLVGSLRLGVIYTIAPYLLPRLIPALHSRAPLMPMYLHENFTVSLAEQLRRGDLDVIIVALPFPSPVSSHTLSMTKLFASSCQRNILWRLNRPSLPIKWLPKICCCWVRATAFAIRLFKPVRTSRKQEGSKEPLKAVRWKRYATWWQAGLVYPSLRFQRQSHGLRMSRHCSFAPLPTLPPSDELLSHGGPLSHDRRQ